MNFFKTIFRSLYDFAWIREQRLASVSRALGFFTLVVLIVTAVKTAPVIFYGLPKVIDTGVTSFTSEVPDFNAIIQNGQLNIERMPQPFVYEDVDAPNTITGKIYIDTVSTSTPTMKELSEGSKADIILLVNRDEMQMFDRNQQKTDIQSFAGMTPGEEKIEFSKADVQGVTEKIQKAFLPWIASGIFILALLGVWLFKFVGVLFWSLIFTWIARSMGRDWKYGHVFKIVLYAIALPMIITTVLGWAGLQAPLLYTLILCVVMYMVIKFDEIQPIAPVESTPPVEPPKA